MAIKDILRKIAYGGKTPEELHFKEGVSANETELAFYEKKEREEQIRRKVQAYRQKYDKKLWRNDVKDDQTKDIIKQKNAFKGNKCDFGVGHDFGGKHAFTNKNAFKQKNAFKTKKKSF